MLLLLRFSLTIWLICLPFMATAADRVALVIGMAQYQHINTLKNTVNDANRIADTLESIGFDVTRAIDTPLDKLIQVIDDFSFRAETSELALVYYAGHGVEVQGRNFLVPVDADVTSNLDVQRQSVSLKQLLAAVDSARKLRIVILDSCRDNPFGDRIDLGKQTAEVAENTTGTRGEGRGGLAPPSPDRGTLVAYAAKDGQVALDGAGKNSPYATALAQKMKQPGLEISLMFRQVRDQVLEATLNHQEPHTYGSLSGVPFYLAGPKKGESALQVDDPLNAWSKLRPDQEQQLAALAENGDTRSMVGLAYMRLNPAAERYDPSSAVKLLTRASDAGSPEAQFELAKLYEQGVGVEQDSARALELYKASAAQDYADAINDLGFMYYQGALGLPQDKQTALTYFERAADLRHPQAMFNFAALIDDGLVPGKGPKDAAEYLYQALRSGSSDVLNLLTERPAMFKDATRKALQEKLREYSFYDGSIDGDFGPGTKRGIRAAFGLND